MRRDAYGATRRRMFQRIGEEITHDLLQFVYVYPCIIIAWCYVGYESYVADLCRLLKLVYYQVYLLLGIRMRDLQTQGISLQLIEVEHLVY